MKSPGRDPTPDESDLKPEQAEEPGQLGRQGRGATGGDCPGVCYRTEVRYAADGEATRGRFRG